MLASNTLKLGSQRRERQVIVTIPKRVPPLWAFEKVHQYPIGIPNECDFAYFNPLFRN